jgi:hypothetical protein
MPQEFRMKLRYSGGDADDHHLDLYEATTSLQGFAQALQICVHFYLNDEVTGRATALKGAKLYIEPPRRGSVTFDVVAFLEKYPATVSVAAPAFYDFIKYAIGKASGYQSLKPQTPYVTKLATDKEPHFDRLAETIEGGLQRAHRPIGRGVPQITLERPRSILVKFDRATKDWVDTRDLSGKVPDILGNVTRYNTVTSNGRAYIQSLRRIIPFSLDKSFPAIKKQNLTWSLHGDNIDGSKELNFTLKWVESARGEVKRIILFDCDVAQSSTED